MDADTRKHISTGTTEIKDKSRFINFILQYQFS